MSATLAEQAREALRLAEADPGQSAVLAATVGEQARSAHDAAAGAIAARARGLAALHTDDAATAIRHLRTAITLGRRAHSPALTAEARMTLAYVLNGMGRSRQALREIDAALTDLHGVERARAEVQRGAILQLHGRLDEALASHRRALPDLRRADDHLWVQRALLNRAVIYGYRSEFGAAERDLREAERLCEKLDLGLSAGFVHENLGWIDTLRGDVPAALSHLDAAEARFRELGSRLGFILHDRSELLLSVNLLAEARQTAEQAVRQISQEGQQIVLPEARLVLARAAALDGDSGYAVEQSRRAVTEFDAQRRPHWAALARYRLLSSRLSEDGPPQVSVRQLVHTADELSAAGWTVAALEARLLAGQLALERGRQSEGCRILAQASVARRRGPALVRSRAWYAEALMRLSGGNPGGASHAARCGLRVLDEHRATLGATDLRAYASGHRSELAALGLRIAVESGRATRVLAWAEEGRARHLLSRPALPPDDPQLADALARLRVTVAELEKLRHAGRHSARLTSRQASLERQIRDHCRRQPPRSAGGDPAPAVPVTGLAAALGEAALVEFIQLDGVLYAVTVVGGRARLQRAGALDPIRDLVEHAAFALRRLARYRASDGSKAAAISVLRHTAGRLDAMLLRPFERQLDGRALVMIPTGPLQSLPWSVLPSCAGRPVTVAPSAALWYSAQRREPRPQGGVAVACGPGLRGARAEAEAVAGIHQTTALLDSAATVHALTERLRQASMVHLAAHGHVRADNPLFSSLRLADGPLTVFDLERLERVTPTLVLAACDSGRPVVCTGDELLGFGACVLSLGAQQVVGSVVPIPDAETAPLMVAFHRQLAAGQHVAAALSHAQRQLAGEGADAMAAAAGFVCIGAGMKAPALATGSSRPDGYERPLRRAGQGGASGARYRTASGGSVRRGPLPRCVRPGQGLPGPGVVALPDRPANDGAGRAVQAGRGGRGPGHHVATGDSDASALSSCTSPRPASIRGTSAAVTAHGEASGLGLAPTGGSHGQPFADVDLGRWLPCRACRLDSKWQGRCVALCGALSALQEAADGRPARPRTWPLSSGPTRHGGSARPRGSSSSSRGSTGRAAPLRPPRG
jgi:tetratricopeptide (TPR) repeat protein